MRVSRLLLELASSVRAAMATGGEAASRQPPWRLPDSSPAPTLKLYNSLTRNKEEFVPLASPTVSWYSCGPTVYDAAHMGHARSYITFDILRRVLSDYFGYKVTYVMNVTDIDDKIIRRARRNHLLAGYQSSLSSLDSLISDVTTAMEPFRKKTDCETDKDKKNMLQNIVKEVTAALEEVKGQTVASTDALVERLFSASADPLADWLDKQHGSEVREKKIFAALTKHWEEDFHKDMDALNVLPADVLTRVSDYVPEIVQYTQTIMDKGYAYESNGSVYFDVAKFSSSPDHHYAKLVPEAVGDLQALAEGEGELSTSDDRLREKRSRNDFALWKASKPGEPAWASPWGQGRPGWHIECSVMACDILGGRADIHTGGVDLKFPHHDNEIAQAEAHYGSDGWVNYFLHSGHLTIAGCKMSKSLKNFITIQDALHKYSWRQLRLAFLLHQWSATLDYSDHTMSQALGYEKTMNEFFLTVKDLQRDRGEGVASYYKFSDREKLLLRKLTDTQTAIHTALCDSINTPVVMHLMKELVTSANVYLADLGTTTQPNARLMHNIASYLTGMLRVFGIVRQDTAIGFTTGHTSASSQEAVIMPYLTALADFREKIRNRSLEVKDPELLRRCDEVRDVQLAELGVRMEDKEGRTVVKLVGREAILQERERERMLQKEKAKQKAEQKRRMEEARRQREAQAAVAPQDMFRSQTDKFSNFDDEGLPTHDAGGEPLSDKQTKKLRKLWQAQQKKYEDHLKKQ